MNAPAQPLLGLPEVCSPPTPLPGAGLTSQLPGRPALIPTAEAPGSLHPEAELARPRLRAGSTNL